MSSPYNGHFYACATRDAELSLREENSVTTGRVKSPPAAPGSAVQSAKALDWPCNSPVLREVAGGQSKHAICTIGKQLGRDARSYRTAFAASVGGPIRVYRRAAGTRFPLGRPLRQFTAFAAFSRSPFRHCPLFGSPVRQFTSFSGSPVHVVLRFSVPPFPGYTPPYG